MFQHTLTRLLATTLHCGGMKVCEITLTGHHTKKALTTTEGKCLCICIEIRSLTADQSALCIGVLVVANGDGMDVGVDRDDKGLSC